MKMIGFLVMALMVALAFLGVGYASWSQNITVSGTVHTGVLSANFAGVDSPAPVASGNATYTITGNNTTTLAVSIDNVYPGYEAYIPYTVKNTGTLPVNVAVSTNGSSTILGITIDPPGLLNPGATTERYIHVAIASTAALDPNANYAITVTLIANQ